MYDENRQLLCWRELYNRDILFWNIMTEGKYCENFDSVRKWEGKFQDSSLYALDFCVCYVDLSFEIL